MIIDLNKNVSLKILLTLYYYFSIQSSSEASSYTCLLQTHGYARSSFSEQGTITFTFR